VSYFPTHKIRDFRHHAILCEERAVFALAFADRQQSPEDLITASIGTIADDAGVSRKTAQRIVSWGISVGILSMHIRNGFRCYGFHLDALLGLPMGLARNKLRAGPPVPPEGPTVLSMGPGDLGVEGEAMGPPVHAMGPAVPVQSPAVPCSVSAGPPKGQSRTKSRDNQGTISATVPARGLAPVGSVLPLDFGPTGPSTPVTIPAPLVARPEPSKASVESLPVDIQNPPPKGKGKASKKPVRKFTDEQLAARDVVYAFWKKTYLDELGVEPIVGNVEVGQMVQLLKKVQWNSTTACALIKNAFADVFFRERIKTIGNITANPSKYQTAPKSERRSFVQVEADDDFFTNRDNDLAEDYGS
jgi:hypothetical protein